MPQASSSRLVVRNVRINGRRTSIRLEPEFWIGLQEVCTRENWKQDAMLMAAQTAYEGSPLTSAVRSYLFVYFFSICMGQPRRPAPREAKPPGKPQ